MTYPFPQLNVFSAIPLGANPLAVVRAADYRVRIAAGAETWVGGDVVESIRGELKI